MFLGLRTAIYHAPELEKAKAWYAEVLGSAPYFDQPFYVGFNVGGYELGLQPDAERGSRGSAAPCPTGAWRTPRPRTHGSSASGR